MKALWIVVLNWNGLADTLALLAAKGHDVRVQDAMGSTQSILLGEDGFLLGASDPRRAGALTLGY